MSKLRESGSPSSSSSSRNNSIGKEVTALTGQALSYVRARNVLWIKQDVKQEDGGTNDNHNEDTCEFDRDNLPYLD